MKKQKVKMRYLFENIWGWIKSKFGIPKEETPRALPWNFGYSDEPHKYDWNDWHRDMKKKYPIRHWIFHEFNIWISVKYRIYVEDPAYWVRSFLWRKDHLLDLRKGEWSKDDLRYKWGYADPSNVLEMAIYASFVNYLDELEVNYAKDGVSGIDICIKNHERWLKEEMEKDPEVCMANNMDQWLNHYKKIKEIKIFFEKELPELEKESTRLLMSRPKKINYEKSVEYSKKLHKFDEEIKNKKTKMFYEIIKLREGMWT